LFLRHKKRNIGDDLKATGGKLMKLGNSELTRLWNLCPDNLEACRLESRNFMPTLEEYFEEAIDQADPDSGVEAEYK
jgi:THO complex subunit 1